MRLQWSSKRIVVLIGLIGVGAIAAFLGVSQTQGKIYFPIDRETLMITQPIDSRNA